MMSASTKFSSVPANHSQAPLDAAIDGTDKRDRILDAAQSLFVRYGVKRTSIDEVAREAGIAKGTVYLSFKSKAELFAAIADLLCANTLAAAAFDALDRRIRSLLSALLGEAEITHDEATDMILAAGMGTLYTGDDAEQPYRARLTAMIDTLVAGLGRDAKG